MVVGRFPMPPTGAPVTSVQGRTGDVRLRAEDLDDGISSGSNADGSWTRFPDGTQMCWLPTITVMRSSNGEVGSRTWTFPVPFVGDVPSVQVTANAGSSAFEYVAATSVSISQADIRAKRTDSTDQPVRCFAIGRWK